MTIAKRLQFAALIVGLAISVVSARAADDAKEPETYWIVKRTGSTVQVLPANEDTLQPLLKKQAQADTAKRPEGTKTTDKPAAVQSAAATTASGSGKSEPKRLSPAATARTTISPQPKADANVPLPISLTGERLVSGTAPTTYDYDETFPDRVTISRPAPTNPNSAMMAIESPLPQMPDGTSANYNDYHTGVQMQGAIRRISARRPLNRSPLADKLASRTIVRTVATSRTTTAIATMVTTSTKIVSIPAATAAFLPGPTISTSAPRSAKTPPTFAATRRLMRTRT